MQKIVSSRWFWLLSGLLIGALVFMILGLTLLPHTFAGTEVQPSRTASDFTLNSSAGGQLSLGDLRSKAVLVFFGYANCTDVCPGILHELSQILEQMGGQADKVQVLFITLDPERDSPQVLQTYLSNIDSRFLGLTGNPVQIQQVAANYGIYYQKGSLNPDGSYMVDHTAAVFLIDPGGDLRAVYSSPIPPAKDIARDVKYILAH